MLFPQLSVSPVITLCTHAVVATVDLQVLYRADTGVVPQGVVAGTGATDARVGRAFVDVCRGGRGSIQELSGSLPTPDLDLVEPLHYGLELGFKISLKGAGI